MKNRLIGLLLVAVLSVGLTACGSSSSSSNVEPVEKTKVFVSPDYINSVIEGNQEESDNYIILDTSTEVDTYDEGHIPGAVHFSVRNVEKSTYAAYAADQFDETNGNLGNLLPSDELLALLKSYGITKDTVVITYGVHPAVDRVAFMLLYMGVENVKVMDGNLETWKSAGYDVDTVTHEPMTVENYDFGTKTPAHPEYLIEIPELNEKLESDSNFRLVSIRSLDEFRGISDGNYPMLQEKGEIPGAVFGRAGNDANTMEEYVKEDGTLIDYETFEGFMSEANVSSSNEVVFYCGTGWRATLPLLMAYENGWTNVRLYDGGWWQWTRQDEYDSQMLTPEQAATCSTFEYTLDEVTLNVGETFTPAEKDIDIFPASGTLPEVRFKAWDSQVATVDENGTVTAVAEGETKITMVATDFSGRKTSYVVRVVG